MFNPLKIKEPDLLNYHNQIVECFAENGIPFEVTYQYEPKKKTNSTVHYLIQTNKPRAGFILVNGGKFVGVVSGTEQVQYLQKEGFDDEAIYDNEPIFTSSYCVMAFICMLARDRINDLVFAKELEDEFDRLAGTK